MSKIDLISNEWADLVFEGRNQAYGAYRLRKSTSKRNLWSLLIVLIAAVVIFSAIAIKNVIQANQKVAITTEVELSKIETKKQAKVEKKAPVKIEPPKPVEKVKSSIKFTAPVIKKDEDVKPEEEMKNQDELQKTKTTIGAFNVVGNDEVGGEVLKAKEEIAQPEPPKEEENKVFDVVEENPSFPGGQAALMQWLNANIKYPVIAAENGIEGRVIVQFVVSKTGSISDVRVVRGVDPSLDKEAVRVVSNMPNWTPGRQNGTTVNVRFTLPVTFRLQ
ncbi:energy transducer TonB [Marseilla massiliensis]|jgi:protein TonB|uniref:Energy transducer TonB n=1 Tax=Marseilla massiliensis TaxID=1841864 RepID=A0A938WU51_9BACT|nr:energy transducer TonB [Marseilla massiliensis]MBM6673290.1 energy transducer TonB [Marseilla massiliensis]CCY64975.1 tonB protein [Prevotella sp. CAG:1124]